MKHSFISLKASSARPWDFQVNARLLMLVSVLGCSSPITLLLEISNANGPSDAAGAYGGVHRYEDPETLAKAGN
jgi:hypothetical protein